MVAVWSEVTEAYGSLQSQAQPFETSSSSAGPFTDTVEATFQRGQLDISVEFDRSGQILTFGLTPVGKTSATIDLGAQARRVVTQLAAGDYEAVVASLDPLARVAVTASDVRTEWSNFEAAYGPFRGQGSPVVPGAGNLVDVPVTWARAAGYVQVNIDQTGQIASVFVLGPGAPADALGGRLVQANPAGPRWPPARSTTSRTHGSPRFATTSAISARPPSPSAGSPNSGRAWSSRSARSTTLARPCRSRRPQRRSTTRAASTSPMARRTSSCPSTPRTRSRPARGVAPATAASSAG